MRQQFYYQSNHPLFLLFFDIPLLHYYINLSSSIIACLSSGDTYLSLGISLSCSFVIVFQLFCGKVFQTFIIISAILFPVKSTVVFSVFWVILFKAVLSASVANMLAWWRSFWLYLLLGFLPFFFLHFTR